jgi:hypothetical protein
MPLSEKIEALLADLKYCIDQIEFYTSVGSHGFAADFEKRAKEIRKELKTLKEVA